MSDWHHEDGWCSILDEHGFEIVVASSAEIADEIMRNRARVAELEGERESSRRVLSLKANEQDMSMAVLAQRFKDNAMEKWEWWQAEAARRSRTGVVGDLNRNIGELQDQLNRSVEREDELQAQLDRANAELNSKNSMIVGIVAYVNGDTPIDDRLSKMVSEHADKQLDRATEPRAGFDEPRQESERVKSAVKEAESILGRATTPRPMSEAPRGGVINVIADVFWSNKHREWVLNGIGDWLPAADTEGE